MSKKKTSIHLLRNQDWKTVKVVTEKKKNKRTINTYFNEQS